jgi:glycosyltransferase involved in cell wall biosynthesis
MTKYKPTILTLIDYYLPGYKGGGCIRGVANLVSQLSSDFQFKLITRNCDRDEIDSYPGIHVNSWTTIEQADVFYASPQHRSFKKIRELICQTEHQAIYLNSFFSPDFTIKILLLRKLKLIPNTPVILAPRGELSPHTLALKSFKKRFYLTIAKLLDLYQGIVWQATSLDESADIISEMGATVSVVIAPELSSVIPVNNISINPRKKSKGILNIFFLSRICRIKNLSGALNLLKNSKGQVNFDIYGPIEDHEYWEECKKIIKTLPNNICVQYYGSVSPERVIDIMQQHDILFLPSLSESFGYVILEALVAGCPILISDQTIWRNLEMKGIGWDISLEQPEYFHDILQQCVEMDDQDYIQLSKKAKEYGQSYAKDEGKIMENLMLFKKAIL